MTKNNPSSDKKTNYTSVIFFAIITLFIYGAWTKARVDNCIADARYVYSKEWAAACKITAKIEKESYTNCISLPGATISICKSALNPKRDASANCALPAKIADRIELRLEKEKNFCVNYG